MFLDSCYLYATKCHTYTYSTWKKPSTRVVEFISCKGINDIFIQELGLHHKTKNKHEFSHKQWDPQQRLATTLDKNRQTKVLKTNGSLMKVESIAECLGAFCNTFGLHLSNNRFFSPVNNRIATNYHYTNSSSSFLLFYLVNFYFFHLHHV